MYTPKLFLLYKCGVWKKNPSLVCVCGSERVLMEAVTRHIKNGDMEYEMEGRYSTNESAAKQFREDYDRLPLTRINDKLKYGLICSAYKGEDIYPLCG